MDLGEGIRKAVAKLRGATVIDSKTIKEFNKELQKALISADVDIRLVFSLTKRLEDASLRTDLPRGISPRDYVINMLYDELVGIMGTAYKPEMRPKRILLLGMYGSGKTTTAAKLAKYYQDRGISAALICCDVVRPAAYEQLETLAAQANVAFFGIKGEKSVQRIVREGLAQLKGRKIIICDSSGRNALDDALIHELKEINESFRPDEKLLVVNADIGQVASKQAREFDKAVKIDGVLVTKLDGSGKGGGALSAVKEAGVNITFIGVGEKLKDLELYDPNKFVGRLLGMPDLEGLVEKVNAAIMENRIKPEEMNVTELNCETFYTQLKAMSGMGPLKNMLGMMGVVDLPKDMLEQSEEKLAKYKVIISSMTKAERTSESLLNNSGRVKRIAIGSGTSEKDVRSLVGDFVKMKKMLDRMQNDRGFRKRFSKLVPGM